MSNPTRISSLDGVRGLATLMVLSSHFWFDEVYSNEWWWSVGQSGWMGVDLFFVLSGFLITGILLKTKGQVNYFSGFYYRRALRIFPLYYAVLLYSVFAILVIDQQPEHLWNGYDSLGWMFAFLPNVAMALKNGWLWQTNWAGLSHLWSLAVEEQFYLFWPLAVWVLPRKWLPYFCIFLLVIGTPIRNWTDLVFGHKWSEAAYVLPYCRMDGLAAGSLLAVLTHLDKIKFKGIEQVILRDLTFLSFLGLFYYLVAGDSQIRGTFAALTFAGFVYLALCEKSAIRSLCENRFLRHVGMYSYGLYIFHQLLRMPFTWYIQQPLISTGLSMYIVQILYMLLAFAATYVCARISWVLI
jgi:peptidoglycan/LPS O-acetylase OafA/YrhL